CVATLGPLPGLGTLAALAAGQVALAVAFLLEVGLVPAAAGQPERWRGHLAAHALGRAVGAGLGIRVGELLQAVELVAAGGALEGVDRHGRGRVAARTRRSIREGWGRPGPVQAPAAAVAPVAAAQPPPGRAHPPGGAARGARPAGRRRTGSAAPARAASC